MIELEAIVFQGVAWPCRVYMNFVFCCVYSVFIISIYRVD